MRTAAWLLVIVAIGAIARAEPATGTVVVSCNEADASLLVDGVLLPERTPAVLTLPAGTHVIEARKPPLVAQKQVIQVADQQQTKVRFELLPPAPPPPATGSDAGLGSGSGSPPATGSAAPLGSGSGSPPGSGSAAPLAGSAAPPAPPQTSAPAVKAPRCTEGGHEVPCAQGPRCTEGGRPVPCKKGEPLPQPPPTAAAIGTGSGAPGAGSGSDVAGAGSNAHVEPLHGSPGAAAVDVATTMPHAIAYVDGAPVREAPCVLELEPGEHVVAVYAAGMVPAEALVRVAAGQRQRVELTPSKPRRRIDVPAQ